MDINEFFYSEALMTNDISARITQKELLWPQGRKGLAKVLEFLRSLLFASISVCTKEGCRRKGRAYSLIFVDAVFENKDEVNGTVLKASLK